MIDHDRATYSQHNLIERMFCRFKECSRVAARFAQKYQTSVATIAIAALAI